MTEKNQFGLRLAELFSGTPRYPVDYWPLQSAIELRRLVEENQMLLSALKTVVALPGFEADEPYGKMVIDAIAKATSQ